MNNYETEISIRHIHDFWINKKLLVVHCGAHKAEELDEYLDVGWDQIIWIEANPELIPVIQGRIKDYPSNHLIHSALWSSSGKSLKLKVANNSYSSSMLDFGTHANTYPEIFFEKEIDVESITLDLSLKKFNELKGALLVLDLQGVELEALKGAISSLKYFDYVYCEVSKGNLYNEQGTWFEISKFLNKFDFKCVDWQYSKKLKWGNAFYVKNPRKVLGIRQRLHRKFQHFVDYRT
jgi:FkbM family methyltransferase